jgi:tetratricopeptide (TPR) repeat protein
MAGTYQGFYDSIEQLLKDSLELTQKPPDDYLYRQSEILLWLDTYLEILTQLRHYDEQIKPSLDHVTEVLYLEKAQYLKNKAGDLEPMAPMPRHNRVLKLLFQELLTACEHALELNHRNSTAHYEKGYALLHLGKREEAIEEYNRAVLLDPQIRNIQFGDYRKWDVLDLDCQDFPGTAPANGMIL